jgi:L-asparaginase/Glu-tRNA(Gln) amidotransferase subunit D
MSTTFVRSPSFVIMAYENMDGALIDGAVAAAAMGVVIARVGNGNMTEAALRTLAKQAKSGIACRVLLRVALLKPRSTADLQRIFDEY